MVDRSADRVDRIKAALEAHAVAIASAQQGVVRVSWSNGSMRVVVEIHYAAEPPAK
jgi:hypothetical protein